MLCIFATRGSSIPVADLGRSEHTLPEASHSRISAAPKVLKSPGRDES
jgi:hypothetical protein